jgi:MYXO-CTERM domain-containing protein
LIERVEPTGLLIVQIAMKELRDAIGSQASTSRASGSGATASSGSAVEGGNPIDAGEKGARSNEAACSCSSVGRDDAHSVAWWGALGAGLSLSRMRRRRWERS